MKIAFIGQKGIPSLGGSIESNVEELSIRLSRGGKQVYVYTNSSYTPKEFKKLDQINLISIPNIGFRRLDKMVFVVWAVFRACCIEKVNIIHWQVLGYTWLKLLVCCFGVGVRQVVSIDHEAWNVRLARFYNRIWFAVEGRSVDQIVVNNATTQKDLLRQFGFSANLIFDGITISNTLRNKDSFLKGLNLERNNYIILINDRPSTPEDIEVTINSFLDAKLKSFRWQNYKLVIFVENKNIIDGRILDLIEKRSDLVLFGDQSESNLGDLIKNCFLVISSSVLKVKSFLQILSFGKGVIVADLPENKELIDNGLLRSTAFDFKYQDIQDLTNKLGLLFSNPKIVAKVGIRAREYIMSYHDWDEVVSELEKIYRRTVLVDDLSKRLREARKVVQPAQA